MDTGVKVKPVFDIRKDVPLPRVKREGAGRRSNYPFRQMEVGDSFVVPDELVKRVKYAARYDRDSYGRKFSFRTVDGVTACWRTA
jgi:hypothetical protein